MLTIRKSYLRKAGVAGILVAVIAAAIASVASANTGVEIVTPSLGNVDVYFDANGNGDHEPAEFVGTYPSYSAFGFWVKWPVYNFPAGVNGSYYVSLWQNTTPLGPEPTWVMRKAGHNFADNPAGNEYLMGPFFDYENICEYCPSFLLVELERYEYADGDVLYFPFSASLTSGKPAGFAQSGEFVLQDIPGKERRPTGPACADPDESPTCCENAGGSWNDDGQFCDFGPF